MYVDSLGFLSCRVLMLLFFFFSLHPHPPPSCRRSAESESRRKKKKKRERVFVWLCSLFFFVCNVTLLSSAYTFLYTVYNLLRVSFFFMLLLFITCHSHYFLIFLSVFHQLFHIFPLLHFLST